MSLEKTIIVNNRLTNHIKGQIIQSNFILNHLYMRKIITASDNIISIFIKLNLSV